MNCHSNNKLHIIFLIILGLTAGWVTLLSQHQNAQADQDCILVEGKEFCVGQTHKTLFTAYFPDGDLTTMEGGFNDKLGRPLDPSLPTCASPREFPYGTKFRIHGTGTERDGTICVSNDTGGAIVLEPDGSLHIDVLLPDYETMSNWGLKWGEATIISIPDKGNTELDFSDTGAYKTPGKVSEKAGIIYGKLSKERENFYIKNNITYYNPTIVDCLPSNDQAFTNVDAEEKDRAEYLIRYLTGAGFSLAQASGITGNLYQESHIRPDTIQYSPDCNSASCDCCGSCAWKSILTNKLDPSTNRYEYDTDKVNLDCSSQGVGLAQWSWHERKKALFDFAKKRNVHVYDLEMQLEFMMNDFVNDAAKCFQGNDGVQAATTPVDAAVRFHDCYEKSADSPDKVLERRGGKAEEYNTMFQTQIPDGTGFDPEEFKSRFSGSNFNNSSGGGLDIDLCVESTGPVADLQKLVEKTAWPLYCNGNGITRNEGGLECRAAEPKPYYKDLIACRSGGSSTITDCIRGHVGANQGQDCGGFVTTIIQESGWDEKYNPGQENTSGQEKWLNNATNGWKRIYTCNEGDLDTSQLQPGDVAIRTPDYGCHATGHTWLYTGQIPNFEFPAASASFSGGYGNYGSTGRFPMAAGAPEMPVAHTYSWYRKIGGGGSE